MLFAEILEAVIKFVLNVVILATFETVIVPNVTVPLKVFGRFFNSEPSPKNLPNTPAEEILDIYKVQSIHAQNTIEEIAKKPTTYQKNKIIQNNTIRKNQLKKKSNKTNIINEVFGVK